ncbi:MAG: phosphoglycerate dehydrogenase, partial [bacterium]
MIAALHAAGTRVYLVSGGLRAAILPLASHLGVAPIRVHAVELAPDADGTLSLLDGEQPLATQRGKPLVVEQLQLCAPIAMVGDGSTDAAVRGVVDTFIAYT